MEQTAKENRLPGGALGRNFENSRETAEYGCSLKTIFDQHQGNEENHCGRDSFPQNWPGSPAGPADRGEAVYKAAQGVGLTGSAAAAGRNGR